MDAWLTASRAVVYSPRRLCAAFPATMYTAETASGVIGNALLSLPLYRWLYRHYFILQSRDNRNRIVSSADENVPCGFCFVQMLRKRLFFVNTRRNASVSRFVLVPVCFRVTISLFANAVRLCQL